MKRELYSFLTGALFVVVFVYATDSLTKKKGDAERVLEFMDDQAAADFSKASKNYQELIDQGSLIALSGFGSRVDFALEVLRKQDDENQLVSACARDFAKFLDIADDALADERFATLAETIQNKKKSIIAVMSEDPEVRELIQTYRSEPSH